MLGLGPTVPFYGSKLLWTVPRWLPCQGGGFFGASCHLCGKGPALSILRCLALLQNRQGALADCKFAAWNISRGHPVCNCIMNNSCMSLLSRDSCTRIQIYLPCCLSTFFCRQLAAGELVFSAEQLTFDSSRPPVIVHACPSVIAEDIAGDY